MSTRERVLAGIVAGAAFIFVNFLLVDYFLKQQTLLRSEVARNGGALSAMKLQLNERAKWQECEQWLNVTMPRLGAEDAAGVELLDSVTAIAGKHSLQIINKSLRLPSNQPEYSSIAVEVEATSTWPDLVAFLHEIQAPKNFIVFDNVTLKRDAQDATRMSGTFKIARWYAPKAKSANTAAR